MMMTDLNPAPLPHDPYIDAVDQALTAAGLESDTYGTSATEERENDGRPTLSAVFLWTGENPLADPVLMPEGMAVFWSPAAGWRWAVRREDGDNDPAEPLTIDTWAAPFTVAARLAHMISLADWNGELADSVRSAVQQWRERPATMTVTVRDRSAEAPWGHGPTAPVTRQVTISTRCPACGGLRGEPRGQNSVDDGAHYWVQTWTNDCGHVDSYATVIAEVGALSAGEAR
ncbi:hypothetical protein [Streptacidiphilus sp. EB129]|uniref:hypothetical protein n=1 Tax=Streptacidiphilus sp. EB129 TaxID=3156262 RepID=UPI003518DF35